jgi:uncharacterized protein (TIGR03435 family)
MKFSRKSLLLTAASIALTSPMLLAQGSPAPGAVSSPTPTTNATPAPAFDVATIKPHPGMALRRGLVYQPDGYTGTVTLSMLVQYAYGLRTEDQVTGVPDWAKNEWFDIQAKMGAADIVEMQKLSYAESNVRREPMMQALLADRFKLKVHPETKQVPVYELVVAKGSSKLIDAATDTNPKLDRGADGKPRMGIQSMKDTSIVEGYSMTAWAGFLSQPVARVGRPVLDKTGLTSTYDFTINWSVYSSWAGATSGSADEDADNAASIFGALKEVGLRLQPATGPIDTIVIDHVEKPTPD